MCVALGGDSLCTLMGELPHHNGVCLRSGACRAERRRHEMGPGTCGPRDGHRQGMGLDALGGVGFPPCS